MIVAIDPGETTGLALRTEDGLVVSMVTERELLWKLVGRLTTTDQVVIEDFVTAGRISKHGLYTVRLVGGVEALCWDRGVRFTKQVPMYRIFCLSRAQALLPLGSKWEHRHEKDAMAHLLAYESEKERSSGRRSRGPEADRGTPRAVRTPIRELC